MSDIKLDETDDFGFTFLNNDELKPSKSTVEETNKKLEGLVNMITPLLDNLLKNPEKEYILWPDRVKKINAFKKKMNDYIKK